MTGYDSFCSIGPVIANVHATGLRTALWRGDRGAELPLLAELRHSTAGTDAANERLQTFIKNVISKGSVFPFIASLAVGDSAH